MCDDHSATWHFYFVKRAGRENHLLLVILKAVHIDISLRVIMGEVYRFVHDNYVPSSATHQNIHRMKRVTPNILEVKIMSSTIKITCQQG